MLGPNMGTTPVRHFHQRRIQSSAIQDAAAAASWLRLPVERQERKHQAIPGTRMRRIHLRGNGCLSSAPAPGKLNIPWILETGVLKVDNSVPHVLSCATCESELFVEHFMHTVGVLCL